MMAQVVLDPVQPHFFGAPVYRSASVREGEIVVSVDFGREDSRAYFAAPLTFWRLQHPGVEPMLSRHCRGISELARDRRRYPRLVEPV